MAFSDFIRRGQLIVPFGVGAMIDFPEDTLMTAGLDSWPFEIAGTQAQKDSILDATKITDSRLQRRLSEMYKKRVDFFLMPSEGKRQNGQRGDHLHPMSFVRFPTYLTCPRCNVLKQYGLDVSATPKCDSPHRHEKGSGKLCSELAPKYRYFMQPVRFLVACDRGHIDDFPWLQWVHRGEACEKPGSALFLKSTGAPGLAGTVVYCTCGRKRDMTGAFTLGEIEKHLPNGCCTGRRPWLGKENQWSHCDNPNAPRTVQRGSAGIHFSHIMTSILIPPYSRSIRVHLDKPKIWQEIEVILGDSLNNIDGEDQLNEYGHKFMALKAKLSKFNEDAFIKTAIAKFNEQSADYEAIDLDDELYRFREYQAFVGERPPVQDRAFFDIKKKDINDYKDWMRDFFSSIVLVEQLKETRVYTGFSRITPLLSGDPCEAPISEKNLNWLPAIEVRGEGIFFQFNITEVKKFVLERIKIGSAQGLNEKVQTRISNGAANLVRRNSVTEEFLLVHSFSHALIRQLAFECGYDTSSLKERIFVGKNEELEMCAVLIYTANGDSEGSLGGLVERARPGLLEQTIYDAVVGSAFCSNDPVCTESGITGQNKDNVVACHACNMLPETSCEHGNYLLDRSALLGQPQHPGKGYFDKLCNL